MTEEKWLIILGGAPCVWDDFKKCAPPPDAKIMVINDMGTVYKDRIDYWVTLHSEKFGAWQAKRAENKFNDDYVRCGFNPHPTARIDKLFKDWGGSSGLFAAKIGLELGFNHIVLCGVPMTSDPNIFRPNEKTWHEHKGFRTGWEKHWQDLRGKVFSMSGWTKGHLNP